MKRISSFNLEEMTYNEIMEYKEANKISSRNLALEMMLMERRTMLKMLENNFTSNNNDNLVEKNNNPAPEIEEDIFSNSIEDTFLSMPE